MDTENTTLRCYLVGGAIRDLLMGHIPTECDYAFTGDIATLLARFPTASIAGKAFPIFRIGQHEFAPVRSTTIEADLLARDLTINAMALLLPENYIPLILTATSDHAAWTIVRQLVNSSTLIVHPLAIQDLRNKLLRPAGPGVLTDDPVRALRAARFAARFPEFTPHTELLTEMTNIGRTGLLASQTTERIAAEVLKACATPAPGRFLTLLATTGCCTPWLAELADANAISAGPPPLHTDSLLNHLAQVMDRTANLQSCEPLTTWMALTHDLGKIVISAEQWPSYHCYETLGLSLARTLGQRLKLPTRYIKAGIFAARWHRTLTHYLSLPPNVRVDLLMNLHSSRLTHQMLNLVIADASISSPSTLVPTILADLKTCLTTILPPSLHNLGLTSRAYLHKLRCDALALKM